MQHSIRVTVNIVTSFARVIIRAIVTLIATRIALRVLGASDYGLYNLLAGTIALLSFVNGALLVSAQRFFSVSIGAGDSRKLNRYYNATLSIHLLLGLIIVLVLFLIRGPLFHHLLNIEDYQIGIGKSIYIIMAVSSAIAVMTIPYSALMNAHENMVMLAIADIISCFIQLLAAVVLLYINHHLLLVYSLIVLSATVIKALVEIIWSKNKYEEAKEHLKDMLDTRLIREILGFVGWNTLGSLAVVVRNQGVAIVLNVFFGTIINTAYGIANQVNSLVLSFATTLTSVFSPIIIQSKGRGDYERMRSIAIFSSKLSFFLSSLMALPILLFLKYILDIWLGDYPDSTYVFCFLVVLTFLVLQLYPGINRAIYASGIIKGYQIAISILLVSILPIGAILLHFGFPAYSIIVIMLISQIGTVIATVYHGVCQCGFGFKELYLNIVIKPVLCFIACFGVFYVFKILCFEPYLQGDGIGQLLHLLLFSCLIVLLYTPLYYCIVISPKEKVMVKNLFVSFLNKVHNN